jgi:transcriptional regulator with XRE-family HTH domain
LSYEALFIFLNFILAQCNRESLEPATISFILRGMCAPNIDTIYRLARGLGLTPHEFLKPLTAPTAPVHDGLSLVMEGGSRHETQDIGDG